MKRLMTTIVLMAAAGAPTSLSAESEQPWYAQGGEARPIGKGSLDPSGTGAFSFAVVGNADPAVGQVVLATGVEAVFSTEGSNNWLPASSWLTVPSYVAPSNGDFGRAMGNWLPPKYYDRFIANHGSLRFSVVHKGVHFIGLNDQIHPYEWHEQVAWLKNEVQGKPARWRFVFLHDPATYQRPLWLEHIHPFLAKRGLAGGFASHHAYYARWQMDGVHYVHCRFPKGELERTFLKITVPEDGSPNLEVVTDDPAALEQHLKTKADIQHKTIASCNNKLANLLPPIVPGSSEPQVYTLRAVNPSLSEEATATFTWRADDAAAARIKPARVEMKLAPTATGEAQFTLDAADPGLTPPSFEIVLSVEGKNQTIRGTVPTARQGKYLPDAPSGPVPDAAKLMLNDKSQVVSGSAKWTGADDASAVVTVVRADSGLTVTADVVDDVIHKDDRLDFCFDLRSKDTLGRGGMDRGVFQISVQPNPADLSKPQVRLPWRNPKLEVVTVEPMQSRGYRVTLCLPKDLLQTQQFFPGPEFLFDVGLRDADQDDEITTAAQLWWSTAVPTGGDVRSWGRLTALSDAAPEQP